MKSGIKSTEFWVALGAAIVPVINKYSGLDIELSPEGIIALAGVAISYILGRSWVKKK